MLRMTELSEKILKKLPMEYFESIDHGYKHSKDLILLAEILVEMEMLKVDKNVLLVSILLHDLFADVGKKHGDLAAKYFKEQFSELFSQEQRAKIIEAVLYHDEKNANFIETRNKHFVESKILYDVDNMDAFGIKGVYRYIKVYASRKVPLLGLSELIAKNIISRYKTLCFESSKSLCHQAYLVALSFFEKSRELENSEYRILKILYENYHCSIPELMALVKQETYVLNSHKSINYINQFFDTLYQCYE
ncbi:MAG: HD domain-containing protein [Fusobacteria bacterium]|nr:HD domain-containing protein [Fusobacteriota bacterium]